MRKLIFCGSCLVALIGLSFFPGVAHAQSEGGPSASSGPHRIALIDVGVVFQSYGKFKRLREDLKQELEVKESEAKQMYQDIVKLTNSLKGGTLKRESPEYLEAEKEVTKLTANLEAHKKQAQMELTRKEAVIYNTIMNETNEMVAKVAKKYHYTLVIRFARADEQMAGADPAKVAKELSRQILFYDKGDDISDTVTYYLNHFDKVKTTSGAGKPKTVRE